MGKEIEHKFLVKDDRWKKNVSGIFYRQGYLSSDKKRIVRIRTIGSKGFIAVKGLTKGISRLEFEYLIPNTDAEIILYQLCERPLIEKTRYVIDIAGIKWEIDEFKGENEGLVIAEVEVASENQKIKKIPDWIGKEVSGDPRYFNSNLIKHPYSKW